jgi:hypothetical protein
MRDLAWHLKWLGISMIVFATLGLATLVHIFVRFW